MVWIGVAEKNKQNLYNPENRCNRYLAGVNDSAGFLRDMSSDAPPDGHKIEITRRFSALLSDDTVRVFAPETCAVGAALCLVAAAVLFWMGLFSAL